ncbi:MAG: ribosome-binding factor A [Ferrimicrobium sp.]
MSSAVYSDRGAKGYGRIARVREVFREVIAEEIERRRDMDDRLELLTVTEVVVRSDLRSAVVLFASLSDEALVALTQLRPALQRAIAQQMHIKRTPTLSFAQDAVLAQSEAVEEVLRRYRNGEDAE